MSRKDCSQYHEELCGGLEFVDEDWIGVLSFNFICLHSGLEYVIIFRTEELHCGILSRFLVDAT